MIGVEPTIVDKLLFAVKSTAFIALLSICALLVSFNRKAFDRIFRDKGVAYWGLFFAFSIIPLALILFLWDVFFTGKYQFNVIGAILK